MPGSQSPLEPDALSSSKRTERSSPMRGLLIGSLLGSFSAIGLFFLLKDQFINSPVEQQTQAESVPEESTPDESEDSTIATEKTQEQSVIRNFGSNDESEQADTESAFPIASVSPSNIDEPIEQASHELAESINSKSPLIPLAAEKPEASGFETATAQAPPQETSQSPTTNRSTNSTSVKTEEKAEREDLKLSKRRWTNLVLFKNNVKGEGPIPDDFPVWNYPKGYHFRGSAFDQHRLGGFKIDGEFIVRNGFLRREFGNTALLHLPPAENFDLEGITSLEGIGGWLLLVGWDIDSKSGYAIYNTKLRNGSVWFAIEIKDGKPVPDSERVLVDRRIEGEGALRVRIEDKKVSMQVSGAYLFKDEKLPNYREGHVAIGTFSPQYGAQNIGIKSMRMKLR